MEDKELLELEEFTLEDIIREFSDYPAEETDAPEVTEATEQEVVEEPAEETPEEPVEETVEEPVEAEEETAA